jgi:hypothetical protein
LPSNAVHVTNIYTNAEQRYISLSALNLLYGCCNVLYYFPAGHGGGWGYSGHSIEAIRFMADTDILLGGFGLFGGRGEYTGKIKVLSDKILTKDICLSWFSWKLYYCKGDCVTVISAAVHIANCYCQGDMTVIII